MTRPKAGAYRDMLIDHADEQDLPSGWYPAQVGQRIPDTVHDQHRYRWGSERQALQELVDAEDDGAPIKTCDLEAVRVQGGKRPQGDAGQRRAERLAEVQRAVWRAYRAEWPLREGTAIAPDLCRQILVWLYVGKLARWYERKGYSYRYRKPQSAEQVSDYLGGKGYDVGPRIVQRIATCGRQRVRWELMERGLIPGGSDMAKGKDEPGTIPMPGDYQTWEELSAALDRSVKTLKKWAAWDDDPMPVHPNRLGPGSIIAYRDEIEAWLKRQVGRRGAA